MSKPISGRWQASGLALLFATACGAAHLPSDPIGRSDRADRGLEEPTVPGASAASVGNDDLERAPWSSQRTALDPAPPRGIVVPGIGAPRTVEAGGEQSAFVWMAVYEVDPSDERIARLLDQARRDDLALDPGDAGSIVYMREVIAAGIDVVEFVNGFRYLIQDGELEVSVRHDDDFHRNDPNGFTITVGPSGG
jgi:hypothetical protein